MAIFRFELLPLPEIEPWGDGSLSWFGLTLGRYHMRLGEAELFRYSAASEAHERALCLERGQPAPAYLNSPYVEYQIARLWSDIHDVLPHALNALPAALHALLADQTFFDDWLRALVDACNARFTADDDTPCASVSDEEIEASAVLFDWLRLQSPAPIPGPHGILIWSHADQIYIRWDSRHEQDEGLPRWESQQGFFQMPAADFLAEAKAFQQALVSAMRERCQQIEQHNPLPQVKIDIPGLWQAQARHEANLGKPLDQRLIIRDWAETLAATQTLLELRPGAPAGLIEAIRQARTTPAPS